MTSNEDRNAGEGVVSSRLGLIAMVFGAFALMALSIAAVKGKLSLTVVILVMGFFGVPSAFLFLAWRKRLVSFGLAAGAVVLISFVVWGVINS